MKFFTSRIFVERKSIQVEGTAHAKPLEKGNIVNFRIISLAPWSYSL